MSAFPPAPPPPASEYAPYGGRPPPPPNHMVMAIVATVVFCLPFGVVSLVYANQVNSKYQVGDYAGAVQASNKAKTWWIVSVVITVVAFLAVILVAVVGGLGFAMNEGPSSEF